MIEYVEIALTNAEVDTLCINPCPHYPSGYGEPTWRDWRGERNEPLLPARIRAIGYEADDIANGKEMLEACQALMPRGVRARYISEKLLRAPEEVFPVALRLYATPADREAGRVASWAK